jgi:outer membrane protein
VTPGTVRGGGRVVLRRCAALALAAVVMGGPGGASAQESVPDSLTFDAAVRVALRNNPAYLRQLNAVTTAEHGERQTLGQLFPSLSASVGFDGTTVRNKTGVDELGRPLEEPDFVENTTSSASQGVGGNVDLFNLQSVRSYAAARAQTDASEAGAALEAARLRTQVGTAYFDVVQREQLVEVERRGLATALDQLEAIRRLLRVGAKQPTDVLGGELDVARADQAVRQAEGEARKARLTLRERMGVPMESPFELAEGFPPVFDPATLEVEALVARALAGSPRMTQQEAAVTAAERGLSAARAARFPTLSGSYGYGRGTTASEYDAIGQLDLPNSSWSFGVSASLPLFNRFQTSTTIGRAAVDADNARESLREARLAVEREVRAALIDLENAYAGVELAEQSAEIARERLRQGRELYRIGTLQDYTALQQMIDAVAQEERRVATAYYNFAVALLQLEEKIGGGVAGSGG